MNPVIRKTIIFTCLALSAIILFDVVKAPDAILRFFAAGHIPGTTVYLNAELMLAFWMVLAGVITGRVTVRLALAVVRFNDKHIRRQNA